MKAGKKPEKRADLPQFLAHGYDSGRSSIVRTWHRPSVLCKDNSQQENKEEIGNWMLRECWEYATGRSCHKTRILCRIDRSKFWVSCFNACCPLLETYRTGGRFDPETGSRDLYLPLDRWLSADTVQSKLGTTAVEQGMALLRFAMVDADRGRYWGCVRLEEPNCTSNN